MEDLMVVSRCSPACLLVCLLQAEPQDPTQPKPAHRSKMPKSAVLFCLCHNSRDTRVSEKNDDKSFLEGDAQHWRELRRKSIHFVWMHL